MAIVTILVRRGTERGVWQCTVCGVIGTGLDFCSDHPGAGVFNRRAYRQDVRFKVDGHGLLDTVERSGWIIV